MTKSCKKCLLALSDNDFYENRRVCKKCYIAKQKVEVKTKKTCKNCDEVLPIEKFRQRRSVCKDCFNTLRKVVTKEEGALMINELNSNISHFIKVVEAINRKIDKLNINDKTTRDREADGDTEGEADGEADGEAEGD